MWACYTWVGGTLAPMFSTLTEPDWDKGGRKKGCKSEREIEGITSKDKFLSVSEN